MHAIRFADGTLFDPATGEVRRGEIVTRLEPQPAALLALLAATPGQLVSHDDIARRLWPAGTHVDFAAGVHYAVRQVRAALGDSGRAPRVIETLPRRGYRVVAEAVVPAGRAAAGSSAAAVAAPASQGRRPRRRSLALVAAALLVALVELTDARPNRHHDIAVALLQAAHDLLF
jgi:DNA-binding winged helix-turn-helix (wHTH) protein